MNKYFLMLLSCFFLITTILSGAVYKGQKIFVKKCLVCHGNGQTFVASKNIEVWEDLLENNGKPLADLHLKDKNATKSWEYFNSEKFTKKSKHLKDFLVEYAKDSGNTPACD